MWSSVHSLHSIRIGTYQGYVFFLHMGLLLLGSSHAMRIRRRLRGEGYERNGMEATGIPGGRLSSEGHRRRLLMMAKARRPSQVVLIIGGNDLCGRDFDLSRLSEDLKLLGLGQEALRVGRVLILPILPRERTRVGDVSPEHYEQRRVAANRIAYGRQSSGDPR